MLSSVCQILSLTCQDTCFCEGEVLSFTSTFTFIVPTNIAEYMICTHLMNLSNTTCLLEDFLTWESLYFFSRNGVIFLNVILFNKFHLIVESVIEVKIIMVQVSCELCAISGRVFIKLSCPFLSVFRVRTQMKPREIWIRQSSASMWLKIQVQMLISFQKMSAS